MSKLHLIHEIATVVKMATEDCNESKLQIYLDDLLSNYQVVEKDEEMHQNDAEDYLYLYLNALKLENYSSLTITNYSYELNRFIKFIEKPVLKASTADVRQYLAAHGHLKPSSLAAKLAAISAFYNWLVREEVILKSPTLKIKSPKLPKKVREGLSIEELEMVREACVTLRQRALIEVFYSTGCRSSELRRINIKDIDWQNMSIKVLGKGNKERIVFLSYKAIYHLKNYLNSRTDDCEALFVTERKPIRRLAKGGVRHQIDLIEAAANISRPLTPHIMRHTFAQLSMDAGIELSNLQQLMGHEKPETTQRYALVSEERKREAFRKFHVQ